MMQDLQSIQSELQNSKGQWRWHAAQTISEILSGCLATYGRVAEITNQRHGLNIVPRNVGWLRGYLYFLRGHETAVPLHRIAKVGDVKSLADSPDTKKWNDQRRGQEGSLQNPLWW